MRSVLRRALRVAVLVAAVALPPAINAAVTAPTTFAALYAHGPDRLAPPAEPAPHDPAKPTAVVVVGENGAVVTDVLAPYEILAATGRFNVYTVAPQRRPVPLTGGLDLVPDLAFDDLARRVGTPDLVVVPALPDDGEPSTAPVTAWLRGQAAGGAQLLGVCNGGGVLASAGLLDGRPATAHWLRIGTYEKRHPDVEWVRGQRVVDDGNVVTTAGITASIDGTLHVVERMAGPAITADAAAAIGWRHYGADPPVTTRLAVPDPAAILNAGYRWNPPTIGVLLTDGVGEVELASVFDGYGQSLATRTLALSADGAPVRSRHGLTFLPRADHGSAGPGLDRLLVPGAAAAARPVGPVPGGPEPQYLHDRPGFAYDAAIADLAATTDVATARWTARVLELPTDGLDLRGSAWPWAPSAAFAALALTGIAAATFLSRALERRRRTCDRAEAHAARPRGDASAPHRSLEHP